MGVSGHTGGVIAEAGGVGVSERPAAHRGCGVRGAAPPLQETAAPQKAAGVWAKPSRNH